jgi:putative tryptophan/tyrosine transport system substrate-binding protein
VLTPWRVWSPVLALALALALAVTMTVHGQPTKVYRIGFLGTTSPKSHGAFVDAFREGLRERGYVEGKNLTIEYRWAESDYARLPALAAELVRLKVDLILTHGSPGSRAAKEAATTIPIVIAITGDAVATGLVQSLARPGGNITGSTFFFPELNAKRIEILKEVLPGLKRVAALMNDDNRGNVVTFDAMAKTARTVNVELVQVSTRNPDDFEKAFAQIMRSGADAVSVYEDPLFVAHAARLAALAERHRLPSMGFREYADAGGLLGFGVDFPDVWRRAAGFADRIFKGTKPSDIPMQQPEKYDTVVNLKTAKILQLTIPRRVLLRADKVIE